MRQVKEYWCPDDDKEIVPTVLNEWDTKGVYALSLCASNNTVVQAGGNIGIFPIKLAEFFKRVITFEPFDENIRCLKANIAATECNNITVYEAALSDNDNSLAITEAPKYNCGAVTVGGEGNITAIPLDSLQLDSLDLLWLDVEGFEWKVLLGGVETIKKYKPVIILENKGLIPGFGGDLKGSDKLVEELEKIGYKKVRRIMRDDFYVYKN